MSTATTTKSRRIAPGPRGNLVMGNLADYTRDPIGMLMQLHKNYGDVARNRLGPFMTHALAHPKDVDYVLGENHRNYCRGRFYDNFKLFFGDGLLTTEGDFWRRHRRIVQPVFHKGNIDDGTAGAVAATQRLIDGWMQLPQDRAIDVIPEMMHYSLDALGLMMFNTDISKHSEPSGPLVRFAIEAMMPQGNVNDLLPRWLPTPFMRKVWKARRGLDAIINEVIEDHRNNHGSGKAMDIITLLLEAKNEDTGQPLSAKEVHEEVMTIFLAGHETTGSGIGWVLLALAQYPNIFRQLREELDARLGGRMPTAADLNDLTYLDQVVQEAMRIYPPIWAYTRDLIEDDEIGGYHIPAKSSIFLSPYVTHRHPEFWSNPEAFDPENFASNAPNRHKYAYFPFGGGMRKCIGFQVALLMTKVLVAAVAQNFDLALSPNGTIVRGPLISLRPLDGINLIVTPRHGARPRPRRSTDGQDAPVIASPPPVSTLVGKSAPVAAIDAASASGVPLAANAAAAGCPFHKSLMDAISQTQDEALPDAAPLALDEGTAASFATEPAGAPLAAAGPFSRVDLAASGPVRPAGAQDARTLKFTWLPVETDPVPSFPAPALAGKRIAIVNGSGPAAESVSLALARACAHAAVFNSVEGQDEETAARVFYEKHGPFDGIVDLTLQTPFSIEDVRAWEAPAKRTLSLLRACYSDWLAEEDANRLFYVAVTFMNGRMGYGADTAVQPLGGLWAGLAKTLPQEIPNCNVRIIDLAPDEAGNADRRIVPELYRWGLFEIGYASGKRHTLQAVRDDSAAKAPVRLGPGDTVLFSGGARGIGLLCAQAIAHRYGAAVIVTGRDEPASGAEPWAALDEAGFVAYAQEQMALAAPERPLVTILRDLERLRRRRELRRELDGLAAKGLPVSYRVCDVTDADAVEALCLEIGASLRVIVHNAGVDQPARLPQKSTESFLATIRTKVCGFANLYAAARMVPGLVQFCNVGSLTGRMGGMTGETDYAAANEALARLGLWAGQGALAATVKTLVWPTWEEVGMITNFDVTKRYVTPMPVQEGVRHWLDELADRRGGEIMFMGAIGRAVTPVQINGFPMIYDVSGLPSLVYRRHHVGKVRSFRIFSRFVTASDLDPRYLPFMHAPGPNGQAMLPPAMLLEIACGAGSWVMAEAFRPVQLAAITDIAVDLAACELSGDQHEPITFVHEADGAWQGDQWMVDVRTSRAGSGQVAARLRLVFQSEDRPAPFLAALDPALFEASLLPAFPDASTTRLPRGAFLDTARWRPAGTGHIADVRAVDGADIWPLPYPPALVLPVNHLDCIARAGWAGFAASGMEPGLWSIKSLTLGAAAATDAVRVADLTGGHFIVAGPQGRVVAEIKGAVFSGARSEPVPAAAMRLA